MGTLRRVGDHGGGECRALAPLPLIEALDHLLAPLTLEGDIDVGRLAADQSIFIVDNAPPRAYIPDRMGDEAH